MRELLDELLGWLRAGRPAALATLVRATGSAPRPPGAAMAVGPDGRVLGSLSGGCVEGAVYELGQRVLASGAPELVSFGYSDDDAFAVGLSCGGQLEVFVQRLGPESRAQFEAVAESLAARVPVAVATVVRTAAGRPGAPLAGERLLLLDGQCSGTIGSERLTAAVADDGLGQLALGHTGVLSLGADGERRHAEIEVLVESFAPPPRLYVFGAIDFAVAMSRAGKFLGFEVTVCDARAVFTTRARFPEADRVVVAWPHEFLREHPPDARTAICVLTHDPKFDVPLLELALRTPAAYVGAMGSRRTHRQRLALLRERGLGDAELARLHSPIGLDLGARTPEETAISIAAEIVARRWGGSGVPLSRLEAPIHHPGPAD
jgi:xanthine dehydrogenase accessory factor